MTTEDSSNRHVPGGHAAWLSMAKGKQFLTAEEATGDVFVATFEVTYKDENGDDATYTCMQYEHGHLLLWADVYLTVNILSYRMEHYV